MTLALYAHPFSSYCQKVLIALYENALPFELRLLSGAEDEILADFAARWPLQRMPILVDGDRTVVESSIIVEHLGLHHPGPVRLVPDDAKAALLVRTMDRVFDDYVMTPMQRIVFDFIRPEDARDPRGVAEARALLDTAYAWLDGHMAEREWAAGGFSLAECAAAPALLYADWVHPIPASHVHAQAYRRRLLARPSFARAVDEARPYRGFFPPGAPDRD
ncbi:MAG: glutathione S-transferase family protein [bacterium]|nr:glutathione S-transferase family protein [bacterium]